MRQILSRLLRNSGHFYVLTQIRTDVYLRLFYQKVSFQFYLIVNCNPEHLFLELIKSLLLLEYHLTL